MKPYRAYLFDLDGTVYRGNQPIPQAVMALRDLMACGARIAFLTNNSSMTPEQVAAKLNAMGIPADPGQVVTSSLVTAAAIREEMPGASVYAIGEEGLLAALRSAGCRFDDERPDVVVVGIDRRLTYEKLAKAALAIQRGARFYATNPDRALPSEQGLLPGNGALLAALATTTGIQPRVFGKPEPAIVHHALKRLGISPQEALMVGDNGQTDIPAGARAGTDTLLVLTGVTRLEEVATLPVAPTYVAANVKEWFEHVGKTGRAGSTGGAET
ncbi:MAG TPA: TIGR01457 family HAD-type hydrolase [Calditerricola sp.]